MPNEHALETLQINERLLGNTRRSMDESHFMDTCTDPTPDPSQANGHEEERHCDQDDNHETSDEPTIRFHSRRLHMNLLVVMSTTLKIRCQVVPDRISLNFGNRVFGHVKLFQGTSPHSRRILVKGAFDGVFNRHLLPRHKFATFRPDRNTRYSKGFSHWYLTPRPIIPIFHSTTNGRPKHEGKHPSN